jgi:hypothetical protein
MPVREEVIKRFGDFSGQLSTQVRTLAFGILALSWGLLTSKDSPFRESLSPRLKWNLVGVGAAVILVLIIDAIHYLAALTVEKQCLVRMGDERKAAMYDSGSWPYFIQEYAFRIKLIVLGVTAVWLLVVIAVWLRYHF